MQSISNFFISNLLKIWNSIKFYPLPRLLLDDLVEPDDLELELLEEDLTPLDLELELLVDLTDPEDLVDLEGELALVDLEGELDLTDLVVPGLVTLGVLERVVLVGLEVLIDLVVLLLPTLLVGLELLTDLVFLVLRVGLAALANLRVE